MYTVCACVMDCRRWNNASDSCPLPSYNITLPSSHLRQAHLHFGSERYDHPHRDVVSINEISPIILSLLLYKINLT